jgi:hypothetical protein
VPGLQCNAMQVTWRGLCRLVSIFGRRDTDTSSERYGELTTKLGRVRVQ